MTPILSMPTTTSKRLRRDAVRAGAWVWLVMTGAISTSGCVLVMDTEFERYHAASAGSGDPDAGSSGAAGSESDASVDVEDASTGGSGGTGVGGTGGTSGTSGTGGTGGAGGTVDAGPTCSDEVQNQGEENIDCGGPCPPCPVLLQHQENFNAYPAFGPDGAYSFAGTCANDPLVDGWRYTDNLDPAFTRASSFYAIINTDGFLYVDLPCDDSLFSPILQTAGAQQVTIDFDSSFLLDTDSTASVVLLRDGVGEPVWERTTNGINQHVTIGPEPLNEAQTMRLFFRYEGTFQYYWKVDNIVVEAR
jgi:hypothetical protein